MKEKTKNLNFMPFFYCILFLYVLMFLEHKNVSANSSNPDSFLSQKVLLKVDQDGEIAKDKRYVVETEWQQQQNIVKGKVTDNEMKPVPGVTIVILGTTKGVITNNDGTYSVEVQPTDKLIFSFIGLESQTIEVGNQKVINVKLNQKVDELEEVTVVAFGKQKKESVISSITTVSQSELKVPASNLTTALAGRMAGLISYQRSGEPGRDDADFFIRGVTSFGYSAKPLILLDGLEVSSSDLAKMQPDDIASFSIMKDATATSLYGARGANGVILVTTKEGKEGKAKTSFRYETSISTPTDKVELADPITYMRLGNEAIKTRDPLGVTRYSREKIDKTAQGLFPLKYPATDWHSMLFNDNTLNHRLNFNVSGGGKIARYYLAATYNQDNGNLKVDKMNNFNSNIRLNTFLLRSNVNIDITPTTEVIVRLYGTFGDLNGPVEGGAAIYNKVMRTNPVLYPAYYPADAANLHTQHILFGNYEDGGYLNPYADMVKGYQESISSKMIAQFEAHQDLGNLLNGLSMRGLYSTNRYSQFAVNRYYNPFYYSLGGFDEATSEYSLYNINPLQGTEYLQYSESAKTVNADTYMEFAANYEDTFGDDHTIGAMLVTYFSDFVAGNAGNLQSSLPRRNVGLSGRSTYSYASRYFVEANFGYNGSERFDKNNRFGFFPSIGFGWVISNEKFWNGTLKKVLPMVKFKLTDGLVGNDAIGDINDRFFHISQVNIGGGQGYNFGSEFGYSRSGTTISRYENPNITWEVSRKTNVGLEVNLLNMFDINVDLYKEYRRNILMNRTYIPVTMGLQAPSKANVGEAKGEGIDFSIDFSKSFSHDFWMSGRFNFTYATSKYVKVDEPDYSATPWRSLVGQKIGQTRGFVAERLFVDDNEVKNSPYQSADAMGGDIKYKDINNDGVIDDFDMVPIGYPTYPEIIYGFGLSSGYKGLDFSFFFQGLGQESFWLNTSSTAPFIGDQQLLKVYADSHWSESNRDLYAIWPRLSNVVNSNNNKVSTWFMQDGTFLRLKSVELGYSIPERLSNKILMENLRFYVSGTNLLTFSKFKLWDPEMAGNGLGYPIQKVINFGLKISF